MKSRLPLYIQVETRLREMISRGEIVGEGGILPSEEKLCNLFQVSRITVRNALNALVLDRVITRKSGKGTFVLPQKKETLSVHLTGNFDEMIAVGPQTRMELITQKIAIPSSDIYLKLALKKLENIYYYEGLRMVEDKPYAFFKAFVIKEVGKLFRSVELKKGQTIIKILEEVQGVRLLEAERTITSSVADRKIARHLKLKIGSPILLLESVYFSTGRKPIEVGISYCRPDRYQYQIKLIRRWSPEYR